MLFYEDASVYLLLKENDSSYQVIRGDKCNSLLVAHALLESFDDENLTQKMFKLGSFQELPTKHIDWDKDKLVTNSPQKPITISENKLFDYCDNGGHLEEFTGDAEDGEDPTTYADNGFLWKNNLWYYVKVGAHINELHVIPLRKELNRLNKIIKRL